jgi:hypothetical protein
MSKAQDRSWVPGRPRQDEHHDSGYSPGKKSRDAIMTRMMDLLESSSDRLAAPNKISKKNLTKSLMVAKKVSKLAEVGD